MCSIQQKVIFVKTEAKQIFKKDQHFADFLEKLTKKMTFFLQK